MNKQTTQSNPVFIHSAVKRPGPPGLRRLPARALPVPPHGDTGQGWGSRQQSQGQGWALTGEGKWGVGRQEESGNKALMGGKLVGCLEWEVPQKAWHLVSQSNLWMKRALSGLAILHTGALGSPVLQPVVKFKQKEAPAFTGSELL